MDMENVIKGLQNLRDAIATDFIHEVDQAVGTIDDAISLLKEQEAVVRCKDCFWWGVGRECDNSDSPCFHNGCTHGNWFCADGERR